MSCTPQIAAQSLLVCATGLWQRATRDISVEHYVARLDCVPMIVRRLTLATSAGLHLLNPGKNVEYAGHAGPVQGPKSNFFVRRLRGVPNCDSGNQF